MEQAADHDDLDGLTRLRQAAKSPPTTPLPTTLRVAEIKQVPEVFQPRGQTLDEHHVQTLVRAIGNHRILDPVLVIQLGQAAYLIDGHHRLEAYAVAGIDVPIPIEHFLGSLEDAILEAGRTNSKAKLPMSQQDRLNFAWRLVRMGSYSKKNIR
jgi:ParB-like nuclease domain